MTAVIDTPSVDFPDIEDESTDTPVVEATADTGTKRERDFTKFRPAHQELADYINANSGLDPVTPNQVKAMLALRVDFAKLPEQVEARAARKTARAAAKSRYEGLSPEQIKAAKAAERAERQAARLEAKAKAEALRSSSTASGEDVAAAVVAAQSDEGESSEKRRIGRRK